VKLEAAELVAFDVFEPALRSRGDIGREAAALASNAVFRTKMKKLFGAGPNGILSLPTLGDQARRIEDLEERLEARESDGYGRPASTTSRFTSPKPTRPRNCPG